MFLSTEKKTENIAKHTLNPAKNMVPGDYLDKGCWNYKDMRLGVDDLIYFDVVDAGKSLGGNVFPAGGWVKLQIDNEGKLNYGIWHADGRLVDLNKVGQPKVSNPTPNYQTQSVPTPIEKSIPTPTQPTPKMAPPLAVGQKPKSRQELRDIMRNLISIKLYYENSPGKLIENEKNIKQFLTKFEKLSVEEQTQLKRINKTFNYNEQLQFLRNIVQNIIPGIKEQIKGKTIEELEKNPDLYFGPRI